MSLNVSATLNWQSAFFPCQPRIRLDITTSPTKPNNYFTFFTPWIKFVPSPYFPLLLNLFEQPRGCSTREYAYKSFSLTHTYTHTHTHTLTLTHVGDHESISIWIGVTSLVWWRAVEQSKPDCYAVSIIITPWCRVLLEKLTGLQLVKKFPTFHGTRRFITAFTSVRHLSLSWASPIQSTYPHPTSWRSILILSTHLRLGLPSGLLPSGFPTKNLYTLLSSPIRATCPAHLILVVNNNIK